MSLPPSLITSLAAHSYYGQLAALSTLTALTRLEMKPTADEDSDWNGVEDDDVPISISAHHLRPLTRLRQLSIAARDISGNAEELLALAASRTWKHWHCQSASCCRRRVCFGPHAADSPGPLLQPYLGPGAAGDLAASSELGPQLLLPHGSAEAAVRADAPHQIELI
jgi:hypothetical protein